MLTDALFKAENSLLFWLYIDAVRSIDVTPRNTLVAGWYIHKESSIKAIELNAPRFLKPTIADIVLRKNARNIPDESYL
nr:hypothetical protein Ef18B006LT_11430 [Escherichia fergusonii]